MPDLIDGKENDVPLKMYVCKADGNCFFRVILFLLTGSECQHVCVRELVVKHMTALTVNQTSSSKVIEPNFYKNFLRADQHLGDFFTCNDLKITDRKGDSGTARVIAHCDDLSSLENNAIQPRKFSSG